MYHFLFEKGALNVLLRLCDHNDPAVVMDAVSTIDNIVIGGGNRALSE